jgi:hypothetical protein
MPHSLKSIFGRAPKDIELPNESGKVDKRLPKSWATEKVHLRNVGKNLKKLKDEGLASFGKKRK